MTRNRLMVSLAGAATSGLLLTACGGISDDDREQASEAALAAVGEGRVVEVDEADGDETAAYNVEVGLDSGADVDVELDDDFEVLNQGEIDNVLSQQGRGASGDDSGDDGSDDSSDDSSESASPSPSDDTSASPRVDDDTPLEGSVKRQAERAALDEVGGGRVTESTYADADEDHVYEVEVERRTGDDDDDVTVELDQDFGVVRVDR
ncbi:PepSY domain-containing protein [Nocardioides marmoraquaticus]